VANNIHTPDKGSNYSIRQAPPADRTDSASPDAQPWNKSTMEIEPAPTTGPEQGPQESKQEPKGRFKDRIKVSPMNEATGAANKRAVRNWPEGLKKA